MPVRPVGSMVPQWRGVQLALNGYDIEPLTLQSVAAGMDGGVAAVGAQREALSAAVEETAIAVRVASIQTALADAWNGMLGQQVLAAENRMANAAQVLRDVVRAVDEGDQQMMDNANASAGEAPDLRSLDRIRADS